MTAKDIIPKWIEVEIGVIADVVAGGTPKAADATNFAMPGTAIAWLTPADLTKYKKKYISHGKRDLTPKGLDTSSAKLMPKGAVLFSSRAPIGYVAIANNEISTNQGFKSFVFTGEVDSSFAYYFLRSIRDLAESRGSGTTFKELSGANAKKLPFILAPLAEQKQIAAKLDELLAQVDTIKTCLDAIPTILKHFRQSVLAAAVSGKLTEEWRISNASTESGSVLVKQAKNAHRDYWVNQQITKFTKNNKIPKNDKWKEKYEFPELPELVGVPDLPAEWAYVCAETIVEPGAEIVYGIVQPGPKLSEGIPYVRGTDIQNGKILINQLLFTSQKIADKYQRASLKGSDILLGIIRATKVAIVPECLNGANITQGTARLRSSKYIVTKYFAYCLESPRIQAWLHSNYRGIDMPGLNLKDVRKTPIAVPPIEEQNEIVRRGEQLFDFADQIEQRVKDAQTRVNHLTQSILAKAFRCELTTEWRKLNPDLISGENSAKALLERIMTERNLASSKKQVRTAKT